MLILCSECCTNELFFNFKLLHSKLSRRFKNETASKSAGKRKRKSSHRDDDSDSPTVTHNSQRRELNRKEKRKSAQDMNRPRLNERTSSNDSSGSTVVLDEIDDDWLDYDEEDEARKPYTTTSQHDKSLEYVKQFEENQKRQQKMRRKSYNLNRQNSFIKLTTKVSSNTSVANRTASNDFDKYQSCMSLQSEGSLSEFIPHLSKTVTNCFFDSHIAQVSRMSDIYAPSRPLKPQFEKENEPYFKWSERGYKLVIIFLLLGILVLAFFNLTH